LTFSLRCDFHFSYDNVQDALVLARNAVHVVVSDAHDPLRRGPILSQARAVVEKLAGAAVAAEPFDANPGAIIQTDSMQPAAMPDPSAT
jgi:tyrosine-protein phosphatase YwqE